MPGSKDTTVNMLRSCPPGDFIKGEPAWDTGRQEGRRTKGICSIQLLKEVRRFQKNQSIGGWGSTHKRPGDRVHHDAEAQLSTRQAKGCQCLGLWPCFNPYVKNCAGSAHWVGFCWLGSGFLFQKPTGRRPRFRGWDLDRKGIGACRDGSAVKGTRSCLS